MLNLDDEWKDTMVIDRPFFNARTYNSRYSFRKYKANNNPLTGARNYVKKYYKPSLGCMKMHLEKRIPIISWLKVYNIREDLLKDFIGGLTIGIIQIPQSMGYSLMAGLPPVNGLYTTFFSVLIYFIFGTSRHLSIGKFVSISIALFSSIKF